MKYYTLEELKPGMRVSIASLDKIVGVTIGLDVSTYVKDDKEIGFANILYIGSNAPEKNKYGVSEVLCIHNTYDVTDDNVTWG